MSLPACIRYLCVSSLLLHVATAAANEPVRLWVMPERMVLSSPESTDQILVFVGTSDRDKRDVTHCSEYMISDHGTVTVTATGQAQPRGNGETRISIRYQELSTELPVLVSGQISPRPISFEQQIIPILSKAGCSSGGCHGKAEGQNGFKLSVFGYDTAADYEAIVKESRGRRLFPAAPERSLLLAKATGMMPHGGGVRISVESPWYRRLTRWIHEGMPSTAPESRRTVSISVQPAEVTLTAGGRQQLRVIALDETGEVRGVTTEADFQSNNEVVAAVDANGLIETTDVPGEAAVLVRYMGHVAVCRVTRPHPTSGLTRPPENNFVDALIWDKLERLGIPVSPRADDATFLRRAFLDIIGTLPSADEARAFLADVSSDKRSRLIDQLLERPEYADYWSQKWADLLQVDKDITTPQGAVAMTRWIRGQFEHNVPYDRFVRSILLAEGSTVSESPAAFYKVQNDAEKAARAVSQLFLGIRIECAQCHHHPFEKWDRSDYYGWAGIFTGIDRRAAGSHVKIVRKPASDLPHPATGESVPATLLGDRQLSPADATDRRRVMADWVTSSQNPYFTRVIANRLFAHFFGRGLVEPLDDFRDTNPAANEPLLDALAGHLSDAGYDQKAFIRTLTNSYAWQLSSETLDANRLDEQNYSHGLWKPVPAEVLLDAVSQATGVPEHFMGWPSGYRAIQIWDNQLPSHFLHVFGRPGRQTVCACERGSEPSMAQALHLMNAEETAAKLQHRDGTAARLAAGEFSPEQIVDELYLITLSRFPTENERQLMLPTIAAAESRRHAIEDILWTLMNTSEFVFNH